MSEECRRWIYSKLVKDESDMLGHIAYSLYKRQKIEYIKEQERQNNGTPPSDEQLKSFQEMAGSDIQLGLYKNKAINLANAFLGAALSEDLERQKEDFLRKYSAPGFWWGVFQGLAASFLFVLLGILLLWGTGGWVKILELIAETVK